MMVDALEEHGYTVLEAEDGNAVLGIVASSERIDLLATDVGLPGINGRQLAEMARLLRPGLKVLFLTRYAYDAALGKEVLGPNTQLLGKPVAMRHSVPRFMECYRAAESNFGEMAFPCIPASPVPHVG
jgi:CheY-like chemotaxis protein